MGHNLQSRNMPVLLLCINLLSPHVKGETPNLSHVIIGFLSGTVAQTKGEKKGCPDQRSILPGLAVGPGSVLCTILKSNTENYHIWSTAQGCCVEDL